MDKGATGEMSDTRFKWLLIVSSITVMIVAAIWKLPDAMKNRQPRQDKLGEYVYYEPRREVIHVDRKCKKLNFKGVRCKRVKLSEFVDWRDENLANTVVKDFCPLCVSDEDYEFIMESIQEQIFEKYQNE